MQDQSGNYSKLYLSLSEAVKAFISEVKKHNLREMATDKWTVKDVFCHLAFWHSYYAQNYSSLKNITYSPFLISSPQMAKA